MLLAQMRETERKLRNEIKKSDYRELCKIPMVFVRFVKRFGVDYKHDLLVS